MDGAEDADKIARIFSLGYVDVAADADAVLVGTGEGSDSYEKEGGGEKQLSHGMSSWEVVYGGFGGVGNKGDTPIGKGGGSKSCLPPGFP